MNCISDEITARGKNYRGSEGTMNENAKLREATFACYYNFGKYLKCKHYIHEAGCGYSRDRDRWDDVKCSPLTKKKYDMCMAQYNAEAVRDDE